MNKQVISSALCFSSTCKCISHIMELESPGCCNLFSVQKTLLRRNTAFYLVEELHAVSLESSILEPLREIHVVANSGVRNASAHVAGEI